MFRHVVASFLLVGAACQLETLVKAREKSGVGVASSEATGCGDGVACGTLEANGLTFSCRFAGPENGTGVVLLHGFPEWSAMYAPLMRVLAGHGFRSVACNQRGYSPGARPDSEAAYLYTTLADDVVAVATAAGFDGKFHLVGHDHGAVLGWVVAGRSGNRLLSFSALSVPHPDAFSSGLFGASGDLDQQMASQYFTTFVLNNSASLDLGFYYHAMAGTDPAGAAMGTFEDEKQFQKALWWYNGAFDAGIMAMPPVMSVGFLLEHGALSAAFLRGIFPAEPDDGAPQGRATGQIHVKSLYVCGTDDDAILCNNAYARDTKNYVDAPYTYLAVDCGHDLLSCGDDDETAKVVDAIVAQITAAA